MQLLLLLAGSFRCVTNISIPIESFFGRTTHVSTLQLRKIEEKREEAGVAQHSKRLDDCVWYVSKCENAFVPLSETANGNSVYWLCYWSGRINCMISMHCLRQRLNADFEVPIRYGSVGRATAFWGVICWAGSQLFMHLGGLRSG